MQVRRVQCYFTSKYDLKVELFSHYQLYSSTLNRTIHYYFIPNWAALINKKFCDNRKWLEITRVHNCLY